MRTLIVDNYDSFTWNLYQLIGEVNGLAPVVVPNDLPFEDLRLGEFDNIVISPGPGRPGEERDFGISSRLIREARLPLLGVCLGHQGICEAFGGSVVPAPLPRHGILTEIRHDGAGVFEGLPSPFAAVRYHSLMSGPLPPVLEATAYAEDGVLMGIRHRSLPIWGVQFHPESIASGHGAELLANFARLTEDHLSAGSVGSTGDATALGTAGVARGAGTAGTAPGVAESAASPPASSAAGAAGPTARVLHRRVNVAVDPGAVFERVIADEAPHFWLDTGSGGRFSFLGDATGPLAEVLSYSVAEGVVRRTAGGGVERETGMAGAGAEETTTGFFDFLDARLAERRLPVPAGLPFEFNLGYVGYLGYELKAETGGEAAHRSVVPDAGMIFADRLLAFDHRERRWWLVALADDAVPGATVADAEDWLAGTAARLEGLAGSYRPDAARIDARDAAARPDAAPSADVAWRHDRDGYLALVDSCLGHIRAGESYEVCLTNAAEVPGRFELPEVYRELRSRSPAPYGSMLRLPGVGIACASPEQFLVVTADGWAQSRPIKGTRPRHPDGREDARLAEELAAAEKDRAENLMIVDLVRNDLGRVCELGSVHVPALFEVESYPQVHQLVSTVRGRLRDGVSTIDCVRSLFPAGSMTGAPKLRTMEIIDALEGGPRGVYSGALGWFGLSGASETNVVIRTIVVTGAAATFGTGGAVIALSDPADEYEETLLKSRALAATLNAR